MSKFHDLKCWPNYFSDIYSRIKTFDFRLNDRDYQVGDVLKLNEYEPITEEYTGDFLICSVIYIFHVGDLVHDMEDFVIMSIKVLE